MIIEWLKIQIKPELREKYIEKDAEIWTSALEKYPAFLGKEVWLDPKKPDEIILVIRWQTEAAWKSISPEEVEKVEAEFDAQMPSQDYKMIEEGEFQVRKFPQR